MSESDFEKQLEFGRVAEGQVTEWLRRVRGYHILAVYDLVQEKGKGPRLYGPDDELVAPDILGIKGDETRWLEVKRKTRFGYFRNLSKWTTGIDLRHYNHYLKVADVTPWPVWLLFLHISAQGDPWAPGPSPVGLFGGDLAILKNRILMTTNDYNPRGMVYWSHDALQRIATLEEVQNADTIRTLHGSYRTGNRAA